MTGVELAPPRPGLRWGRRVTAATVDAGVLVRPLGDVMVLMPPLDVTSAELGRIVGALESAVTRVAGEDLP
jgi:adenosylmethionine-8-amino-7-oxononanoate aminotransferase